MQTLDTIKWGKLGKDFWTPYGKMSFGERRAFLKKYKLQKNQVPTCRKCKAVFFNCYCDNKEKQNIHNTRKAEYKKSFWEKLRHSQELVKQVLKEHEGEVIYLTYSGGIDSECTVNLFKEAIQDGRVKVIVGDTLNDFSQTRERWAAAEKELGIKFVYVRPDRGMCMRKVIETVDFPCYPRGHKDPKKRYATEFCCQNLKKQNMKRIEKEAGVNVVIMGLRGEENDNRRKKSIQYGDYFFAKKEKRWHVCPITYWSIEDVWQYQELLDFNYSKLYDLTNCSKKGFYLLPNGEYYQIRTGCVFCPQAIEGGYLIWLEVYFYAWYDAFVNKLGFKRHVLWAKIEFRIKQLKAKQYQICGAFN